MMKWLTEQVELVMVMVVIPVVLNAVVFWQTDRWIMNSSHSPDVYLPPDMVSISIINILLFRFISNCYLMDTLC
jgi:hypothetical protein